MDSERIRLRMQSESDLTRAVVEVSRFAKELGFTERDTGAIATCLSELGRNILKYAGRGEIRMERVNERARFGIEIVAEDRGPGIEDVAEALRDHYSTGGTLGLGLPGVKRIMDSFEIQSAPGKGTRVTICMWLKGTKPATREASLKIKRSYGKENQQHGIRGAALDRSTAVNNLDFDCAVFTRPCRGERVSGDVGVIMRTDSKLLVAIIDGLGHGPTAHQVARRAERFLRESWRSDLVHTIRRLHEKLKGTVGAAAGLCSIDLKSGDLVYSGVGNTVIRRLGQAESRLVSMPGTLGYQIRKPREQRLTLTKSDVLLLYSDGIKDRFEAQDYAQISSHNAENIARTVVERFGKSHDDATCIALRQRL